MSSGFHQVLIGGYPSGGLTQDRKPAFLANEAYSQIENAYVWRERTKKRDGEVPMGRLSRVFTNLSIGNSGSSPWTFNLYYFGTGVRNVVTGATNANPGQITSVNHGLLDGMKATFSSVGGMTQLNGNTYTITVVDSDNFTIGVDTTAYGVYTSGGVWVNQPNAEIKPGSVIISIATLVTPFVDQGDGTFSNVTAGNSGTINYMTGSVTLTTTVGSGHAATVTMTYFPALPVMGILKRDVSTFGIDSTVFFDTTYAYQYVNGFQGLDNTTTWTGTNVEPFWAANYQGASADLRYFFVTNNNIDILNLSYDPIRYYNNSVWTDLQPILTSNPLGVKTGVTPDQTLWQALILIPYYGRLLALNTWEGTYASGYTGAVNYFSRCRFSQLGDPIGETSPATDSLAWRSDVFGRGGFIDAPTNEAIVSAAFFRNTLIVFFEYSTWQLRYVGEYGLPFIWERISSDFGAVSPYSPIVFDQGVMAVSDRGIIQASASGVSRLDEQIPEQVFSFEIQHSAPNFVHGIRDFEKELVYWNYIDTANASTTQSYPNAVLVFNYRNNTWSKFRDTITCFGPSQFQFGVTWDSLTTSWDSTVSWDSVDDQQYVDYVTAGTQQGFINIYQNQDAATSEPNTTLYANSMAITAVDFSANPNKITIPSHNLANGEIIYIQGMIWDGMDPGLNSLIYSVTIVDANTITLSTWNFVSQSYDAVNKTSSATYLGGGRVTLFPKMNIRGKDFNPFQSEGKQFKLSFIDFQMDTNNFTPAITATTIQLFVNSFLGQQANLVSSNQELINSPSSCGYITNATKSNPCQITSPDHSLTTGTLIYINNMQGMTQLNAALYFITVTGANTFTLDNIDSTGFDPYTSGGIWNTQPTQNLSYLLGTQYAWYRFYSTQFGQYLRIGLTYDDDLMNQLATHQTPMELNAMNIWFREGGRLIN